MLTELKLGTIRKMIFTKTTKRDFEFSRWTTIIGGNNSGKTSMLEMISRYDGDVLTYQGQYNLSNQGTYPIKYWLKFDRKTKVIKYDPNQILDKESRGYLLQSGRLSAQELAAGVMVESYSQSELRAIYFRYFLSEYYSLFCDPSIDKCILIDEPETSNDHENLSLMIRGLKSLQSRFNSIQVIIATNSPELMCYGTLIELKPRYLEETTNRLKDLVKLLEGLHYDQL